jgi:hypothetical protein
MKKLITLFVFTFLFAQIQAKHVDMMTAKQIAKNFLNTHTKSPKLQGASSFLALVYESASQGQQPGSPLTEYFYVFNFGTAGGFIIVSADDIVKPVLAYSDQQSFDPNHVARNANKWLEKYKTQIMYAIDNNMPQTPEIKRAWDDLATGMSRPVLKSLNTVNPLVQTTWDQPYPYNASCPYDANAGANCVTGCPATAMAQILKYWNYPTQGNGIHSYNAQNYGTLTANFGSTTYNWGNMPNSISGANSDIANLMFQCGVAVEMNYGVQESSGYVITDDNPVCCQSAFTTYFGYNPSTIQGLKRANYTDANWISMVENELTNSRPVQYAGFGSGGGHTWVCDGFDANNMFHMNWGWSGADDGYFTIDALNPGTLGVGGGTGGFNSGEEALIGIQPINGGGTTTGIALFASVSISPNPIGFAQAFTVSTDVINNGSSAFSGEYCAALFDASGTFISYIGTVLTTGSNPLPPTYHYNSGLTFSDTLGQLLAVPGTYTVGIYYAPAGGSWYLAGASSFTNPVSVTITGPTNGIELYSSISPSPTQFVQGQSASVSANLLNNTTTTFTGQYGVALYDLAGNYVQTIGTYNETAGLQAGYTYTNPLTFGPATITASPGTYILGVLEEQTGTSNPYLVGGTNYTNPINVTVVAAPLPPDPYEADNSLGNAHVFPLNFSGNAAYLSTAGSNIHISSDLDYYRIDLPAGYYYTFNAWIDNASYSGNGQSYTLDAVASYTGNGGSSWSSAFNGWIPNFTLQGGGSVYFLASAYFPGQTGTYLLEMNVTRSTTGQVGIDELSAAAINIYPNPATSKVTITSDGQPLALTIYDLTGKEVLSRQLNGSTNSLDISTLSKGVYTVKAQQGTKSSCQKLVVD